MTDSTGFFVGILGDGQLARMMCQEAHKLNIKTSVLTTSLSNPACLVNSDNYLVEQINEITIKEFSHHCLRQNPNPILTIESEFIDPELLEIAQATENINIYPSLVNIKQLRDRKPQKEFLKIFDIPTSPTYEISSFDELKLVLDQKSLVLKKRLFGYDGYGTLVLKNVNDLSLINSKTPLTEHIEDDFNFEEWIYEDFINFKRELAISFSRNKSGQICVFPWVESYQKNSKCLWVKGPLAVNQKMEALEQKIIKALNKIEYSGFITFEVFETQTNELLINEVAPRVHNSAHYSLEALYFNQFKAHLLGILNQDLPKSPKIISPFAMYNLIGTKDVLNPKTPVTSNSYFLNWYQKKETRVGRKMGHITCLASTFDLALAELEKSIEGFDL